jgi:hypothetical protein
VVIDSRIDDIHIFPLGCIANWQRVGFTVRDFFGGRFGRRQMDVSGLDLAYGLPIITGCYSLKYVTPDALQGGSRG